MACYGDSFTFLRSTGWPYEHDNWQLLEIGIWRVPGTRARRNIHHLAVKCAVRASRTKIDYYMWLGISKFIDNSQCLKTVSEVCYRELPSLSSWGSRYHRAETRHSPTLLHVKFLVYSDARTTTWAKKKSYYVWKLEQGLKQSRLTHSIEPFNIKCKIWDLHGGDYEERRLLWCDTVWLL
jgi:hypothetical protein